MNKLVPLMMARIDKGFRTQSLFAKAIGVNREQVNRMENGKNRGLPRTHTLVKMAEVLDIDINIIIKWFI